MYQTGASYVTLRKLMNFLYFLLEFPKINAPKQIYQIYTPAAVSYSGRILPSVSQGARFQTPCHIAVKPRLWCFLAPEWW
jgi:hypothetical protein